VWHQVVNETKSQGLFGEHEVAGKAHLARATHADCLREQHGQPPTGHHADPRVCIAELRVLAGDEEVAIQCELEATGDRHAVDRPD